MPAPCHVVGVVRLTNNTTRAVDNVRNQVDQVRQAAQLAEEDGQHIADACQQLHHVVEALRKCVKGKIMTLRHNDAVVAGVGLDLALDLHVDAGG